MRNSPPKKIPVSNTWKEWVFGLVIFCAVVVVYWPVYSAGFIWDDNVMLTDTPLMRGPFLAVWTGASGVDFFPITYSSLWLEWHVWGMNPFGYHVTNVLLHALSCVVLWRVFVRLKFPAAWLAALLFALHPVNVESVAWVAERKNVLAMVFYAVTVWAFVRFVQGGHRKWYAVSLVVFLLSLLAKPAAVAWPIVAVAIVWWFKKEKATARGETVSTRTMVSWIAPFVLIAVAQAIATVWFQYHYAIKGDAIYERSFATRVAIAGMAVWFYLGKALVPWRLSFIYPMWNLTPLSPVNFLPLAGLVVLFGVLWVYRRTWGKPLLFGLLYFVLLLSPILGFFKISYQRYSFVADHWQYFALPAVVVLVTMVINKAARAERRALPIIGVVLVGSFGWLTFSQARIYHDKTTIWEDTLAKNPNCFVALGGLGLERMQAGRLEEGIALCEKSLALYPNQGESHANIGLALIHLGRVEEGIEHMRQAERIEPNYAATYCNLGNTLRNVGRLDEAAVQYREAIRLAPDNPIGYNGLGSVFAMQERKDEAVELFRKAVAIFPEYVDALSNLGAILTSQKKPNEGLPFLQRAVALAPNNANAHANLGNALLDVHQMREGREQFEEALRIDPDLPAAKYGLDYCLKVASKNSAEPKN